MKNATITTKIFVLLLSLVSILFLPWLGSYFHHGGNFPDGFYAYPPLTYVEKPGFNLPIFIIIALGSLVVTAVYIFPKYFGFKSLPAPNRPAMPKVKWPLWFWVGLLSWGSALIAQSLRNVTPGWFIHWSDFPLFWGFVLMLDGVVYKRMGGNSLIAKIPQEIVGIGVASISGWMIFEFLNFFVDDNWYYPRGNIIDRELFLLYACIISSGLLPLAFQWYLVFKSFPKFSNRFSAGPKLTLNEMTKNILLLLGLISMFLAGLMPDLLFFTLWTSPPIILAVVLDKIGVWTPLNPISKGDWRPALLSALTYFVAGLTLEGQNFLSASHNGLEVTFTGDPAYWQYNLPYVNVLHVFEMPLLGLYGYLPFGVYCWLWWIACATLLNIPAKFLKADPLNFDKE